MSNTLKILLGIASAIALLAIGFALGVYGSHSANNVGSTSYDVKNFVGDVYQGMTHVLMFQNGAFVGPINSAQNATLSGTNTLSGTTTLSGATTISGATSLTGAATLTCQKVYDGATTTASYYTYASGTAMYVTSTKPALCP